MDFLENKIQSSVTQFDFKIPSKRLRVNKKKKDENMSEENINASYENWKGKGNSGASSETKTSKLFFNKKNLKF